MKIALDIGPLKSGDSVRGIGVYVRELTNSLKKLQRSGNFGIQLELLTDHRSPSTGHFDVVHFTLFNPFFISVPFRKPANTKFILTIYDLIPLIYPKHYPPGIKGWFNWQINKLLIKKNIDAVITISETSKKDICRFIGISPDKVHVTYLAPRSIFRRITDLSSLSTVQKQYNLPKVFALYVGDVNYNKNIPDLVKACKAAKISLVICGKQAKGIQELDLNHPELKHLKNVDWSEVVRLGFVSDEDLVSIYNLATVYVQPSFYEGFGLPAIEAVACGTPIAVAKSQCMVEVLGNDFSFFDPKDVRLIAKAILNPNKNKKFPRSYSWGKTGQETVDVYKNV